MLEKNISRLLCNHLLGTNFPEEEQLLRENVPEADILRLEQSEGFADYYRAYAAADPAKALKALKKRRTNPTKRFVPVFRWMAAASLLVLFGMSIWWWKDYTHVTPPELDPYVAAAIQQDSQLPTHDEGKVSQTKTLSQQTVTRMLKGFHLDVHVVEEMIEAKNIETVRDGVHWVTLDDGTVIHLNNNTRLIYPDHFGHFGDREVILDGEAYFMVAKDRSRAFIVHTRQGDIKVYGTEFHVSTRRSDCTNVVLVEGSVSVTPFKGQETMMRSGQMATMNKNTELSDIDTTPYSSWNSGVFTFEEKPLRSVMDVLCHWYQCDVVYQAEVSDIEVTGQFRSHDDLQSLLESLEMVTNLTITRKSNIIYVNQK